MPKKILMNGNDAVAKAAIQAGCRFYAGYPITPQNEIGSYMARHMPGVGGTFIQSESELAAINLIFGASAAGARAMTSSSSPGISLKQEGLSYLAACQLPAVVVNVMRGGPGLGNIAPAQGDYFQAVKCGGHGDYHQIVLAPFSVEETFELTLLAFDLADIYRNPVIILTDGVLGQMMEPVTTDYPECSNFSSDSSGSRCVTAENNFIRDTDKKKQITQVKKSWALTGCKGRKPNVIRSLLLEDGALEEHNINLQNKYRKIEEKEVRYEGLYEDSSDVILVAYGTSARICKSAVKIARQRGIKAGMIRPVTLWPFPKDVLKKVADRIRLILVVEMSAGQMLDDVRLAVEGRCPVRFYGRMGGGIPAVDEILGQLTVHS